jgi:hypothetical protein
MTACQECGYTVKITVTSNGLAIVGSRLQGIAILLGCLSAYSIWRTLKETSLANQASVSESLASQSIEMLRYLADDPQLYEYFYKNKPLEVETPTRTKSSEVQKSWLTLLSTSFSGGRVCQLRSQEAWMRYVRDHYLASRVVRECVGEHRHWYADAFLNFIDTAPGPIKRAP